MFSFNGLEAGHHFAIVNGRLHISGIGGFISDGLNESNAQKVEEAIREVVNSNTTEGKVCTAEVSLAELTVYNIQNIIYLTYRPDTRAFSSKDGICLAADKPRLKMILERTLSGPIS